MFLKLCKKKTWVTLQPYWIYWNPCFHKGLIPKLCAFNIPVESSKTPVLLFSKNTFFPDFFFVFCFTLHSGPARRWWSASIWVEALYIVVLPSAKCAGCRLGGRGGLCCRGSIWSRRLAGICEAVTEGCQVLAVPWGEQQRARVKRWGF